MLTSTCMYLLDVLEYPSYIQWSSGPWIDFVTIGRQADNSSDFGAIFFPALVFKPQNNVYSTEYHFLPMFRYSETCAYWPKNERREWCWATPFGRFVTQCHREFPRFVPRKRDGGCHVLSRVHITRLRPHKIAYGTPKIHSLRSIIFSGIPIGGYNSSLK